MSDKTVVKTFDSGEGYTANEKNAGEMVAALQSAGVTSAEIYWYPEYTNGFQGVGVQVDEVQWQAHLAEVARLQTASEPPKNIFRQKGNFSHYLMRIKGVPVTYTPYTGELYIETFDSSDPRAKVSDDLKWIVANDACSGNFHSRRELFTIIAKQYFPEWGGL